MTGKQIPRARALRRSATLPERILWSLLRGRRLEGFKFRRQVPFGRFVADFVCVEAKLVIELDGSGHASQLAYDAERTAAIERYGFQVIRILNTELMGGRQCVCDHILSALRRPL